MELFADGKSLGTDNGMWRIATDFVIPGNTKVIAVEATNLGFPPPGILGSSSNGLVTNSSWKCSEQLNLEWNSPDFDDHNRPFYSCVLSYLAMNASEAGGDLALIQTSLLFSCK